VSILSPLEPTDTSYIFLKIHLFIQAQAAEKQVSPVWLINERDSGKKSTDLNIFTATSALGLMQLGTNPR